MADNTRARPLRARPTAVTAVCETCRRWPAMRVTFRQCTGLVLTPRVMTFRGRYCKECASLTFQRTTRHAALLGWWGLFAIPVNLFVILADLWEYRRVRRMGTPRS